MKKWYVAIIVVSILLLGAIGWGAFTQAKLISSESDLGITQNYLYATQDELYNMQSELDNVTNELTNVSNELLMAQDELSTIKQKYPAREFNDINELQDWVNNHKRPTIQWYNDDTSITNEVVIEGITDGYLMFTEVWIFSDLGYNSVAIINTYIDGELYWWRVDETEIHAE